MADKPESRNLNEQELMQVSGGYEEVSAYRLDPGDCILYNNKLICVYKGERKTYLATDSVLVEEYERIDDSDVFRFLQEVYLLADVFSFSKYLGNKDTIPYTLIRFKPIR